MNPRYSKVAMSPFIFDIKFTDEKYALNHIMRASEALICVKPHHTKILPTWRQYIIGSRKKLAQE